MFKSQPIIDISYDENKGNINEYEYDMDESLSVLSIVYRYHYYDASNSYTHYTKESCIYKIDSSFNLTRIYIDDASYASSDGTYYFIGNKASKCSVSPDGSYVCMSMSDLISHYDKASTTFYGALFYISNNTATLMKYFQSPLIGAITNEISLETGDKLNSIVKSRDGENLYVNIGNSAGTYYSKILSFSIDGATITYLGKFSLNKSSYTYGNTNVRGLIDEFDGGEYGIVEHGDVTYDYYYEDDTSEEYADKAIALVSLTKDSNGMLTAHGATEYAQTSLYKPSSYGTVYDIKIINHEY